MNKGRILRRMKPLRNQRKNDPGLAHPRQDEIVILVPLSPVLTP